MTGKVLNQVQHDGPLPAARHSRRRPHITAAVTAFCTYPIKCCHDMYTILIQNGILLVPTAYLPGFRVHILSVFLRVCTHFFKIQNGPWAFGKRNQNTATSSLHRVRKASICTRGCVGYQMCVNENDNTADGRRFGWPRGLAKGGSPATGADCGELCGALLAAPVAPPDILFHSQRSLLCKRMPPECLKWPLTQHRAGFHRGCCANEGHWEQHIGGICTT